MNVLRLSRNVMMNDDRAKTFWKPLFNQVISNLEKASDASIYSRVSGTLLLSPALIEWVCLEDLALPASMYDEGETTPPSPFIRSPRQLPPPPPAPVVPVQVVEFRPEAPPIIYFPHQHAGAPVPL